MSDRPAPPATSPDTSAQDESGERGGRFGPRVAALTLGTFAVGMSEYVLTGQLDLVADGLSTSEAAVGQLVTVFSLTYAIATPVLIGLLARRSRRSVLLAGFAVFALANLVSYFLPDFWSFVAVRVVMAMAAGVIVVTSLASVGRVVPASWNGRGIATVQMGFTASLILGVPVGRILAEYAGWRSVFLVMAALAVISLILTRIALPPLPGRRGGRLADQLALLADARVLRGLAVTLLWLGGYSLVYTYLTPYLVGPVGVTGVAVTAILFLFGLASLVGTQIGGRLADRQGFLRALVAGKAVHVVALVALPLAAGSLWGTAAVLVLWSLAAWASAAPQQIRIAALDPKNGETLIGLNQSTMQLAIAGGAAGGGALIPVIGVQGLPVVGAVVVLASLVLMVVGGRRSAIG